MSYTQHISSEQRSVVSRANGSRGGRNKFVWTKQRIRRAQQLCDDGFSLSDIGRKMNCTRGAVAGMFHREKRRLETKL